MPPSKSTDSDPLTSSNGAQIIISPSKDCTKHLDSKNDQSDRLLPNCTTTNEDSSSDASDDDDGNEYMTKHLRQLPLSGHACVLASSVMMAICATLVKVLDRVDPFLVASVRSGVMACLAGPLALIGYVRGRRRQGEKKKKGIETWQRWLLALRMGVMNIALSIMFYSFRHMPLGKDCKIRL